MLFCKNHFINFVSKCDGYYMDLMLKQLNRTPHRTMITVNNALKDYSEPEAPREEDCCNSGCHNCVLDVYTKKLEEWKKSKRQVDPTLRYDLVSITQFKPFVLVDIKKLNINTNLYTFRPFVKDNALLNGFLPYHAGQHLALKVDSNMIPDVLSNNDPKKGSHVIRDFTITSLSHQMSDCQFSVIIKLYENSSTSKFIKTKQIGDITMWRGPYGDYKYSPNRYSHLIMFCMGTGIAPFYPIINEIVNNEADETVLSLHFGCKTSSDIIFRDEIKEFTSYWNFSCTYYLSQERNTDFKRYSENFVLSRINEEHVKSAVENKQNIFILVCGHQKFSDDIKQALEKLNIHDSAYHLF